MRALILGGGETGRFLAGSLSDEAEIVLVDHDPDVLAQAEESLDALTLHGNATHRGVLAQAEAHRADVAIAVTGNDAVNVAAAVMAREMGVRSTLARVDDPGFYRGDQGLELDVAGIDACICASRLVGSELVRRVSSVEAGFTTSVGGGTAHVALVKIDETSPLQGEGPARLRSRGEPVARAVLRGGIMRAPTEVETLGEGDYVLLLGSPLAVAELVLRNRSDKRTDAGNRSRRRDRAVLIGGGDVGLQLANLLSTLIPDVRLIEPSRGRCEDLARLAPSVSVLHGDGTNLSFLREERVGLAEWVLAVTGSDEINLMSSLLTRELGVAHTFALVHRPGYASVYEHLGIEGTASAHEVMAHTLHGLLPGRDLVRHELLTGTDFELLELRVPPLARALAPRSLPLGAGALPIAVLVHDAKTQARAADPNTRVQGGEHVIVVAPAARRRELVRALGKLAVSRRKSASNDTGGDA